PMLIADSIVRQTPGELQTTLDLAEKMADAKSIADYFRYDREFHLASYRPAKLFYLHSMVERLWNVTQYYRSAYTRLIDDQGSRWILDHEHRLLADAIARKNVDDAQQLIETHGRRTRVTLARHPEIFDVDSAG